MSLFGRKKKSPQVAPVARSAPASAPGFTVPATPAAGPLLLADQGLEAVCASIGFPVDLLSNDTIIWYVLPACMAVFADGDIIARHNTPLAGQLAEWFGTHSISEGRFAGGLTRLCRNPGEEVAESLEELQRAVAVFVARGMFGEGPLPLSGLKATAPPLARIDGAEVVFGGNFGQGEYRERLDDRVNYVLAIEPGVRVMHVIDQQVDLLTQPAFSYSYICASEQPFACQFLANYLTLRTDRQSTYYGMREQMLQRGFMTLAEDDIIASLDRFVELDKSLGDAHGRIDVALFVGTRLPRMDYERVRQILERVHFLVRPGGGLLTGFPMEPHEPGQLSPAELLTAALQAGFTGYGSRTHLGTSNLANHRLPVYSFHRKD
jgi:hypothetical protein